jgi:asparagine synthase (glutamine-hydrolysing)
MATRLGPLMDELLSESTLKARGFFDARQVWRLIDENRANAADHSYLLYALLSLEFWCRTFIDRPAVEVSI